MISLRRRLSWFLLPGLAALIALGGSILYPAVRRVLIAEFDHAQLAKLKALTTFPESGRHGINLVFTDGLLSEFQTGPAAEYFQVWLQDGSVLARSPSLGNANLPYAVGPKTNPVYSEIILPDGRPGRTVGVGFGTGPRRTGADASPYTVSVLLARDTLRLNGVLNGVLAGILFGGIALIVMAGILVHAATRQGLRPVQTLAAQVREIDLGSVEKRLPVTNHPAELRPIAEQVNHLLDRICAGVERERRFSANVAHELLTPVAELRTMAEAAQQWSGDPEATEDFAADTLETARQMEHIVRNLLSLAGAEARLAEIRMERVDLSSMLADLRDCFAEQIRQKKLVLDWQVPNGIEVVTDRVLCKSILFNLLDNALEYTPRGGCTGCKVCVHRHTEILVGNTVRDISVSDLEHLFEPLWRKDSARTARAHTGLGLSVSRMFAIALNAELDASIPRPGWIEISLRLPLPAREIAEHPASSRAQIPRLFPQA